MDDGIEHITEAWRYGERLYPSREAALEARRREKLRLAVTEAVRATGGRQGGPDFEFWLRELLIHHGLDFKDPP